MCRTAIAAVASIVLLAAGCGSAASVESVDELRVATLTEPGSFDPIVSTSVPTTEPIRNVFETLLTIDAHNRVRPMLAKSFEQSHDGKTITFVLREGVQFHDGSTMDATDVVASMNRWLKYSSAGTFHFAESTFVQLDEHRVALRMSQPSSMALLDLGYASSNLPAIMPAEIARRAGADPISRYVGTGPFEFVDWDKGQQLALRKFDDYSARPEPPSGMAGNRTPNLDELTYVFVPDASTATLGVESGEYDVAMSIPYDNVQWLESRGVRIGVTPRTSLPNLYFNKKRGIFAQRKARRALAIGLDRKTIMQAAYTDKRFYDITSDFMANALDNLWDSDVGRAGFGHTDVPKAKQLLAEAGYSGETVTILTSRDNRPAYYTSVVLQGQLRKLGIRSKLATYDYATMREHREDPNAWQLIVITNFTKLEPTQMVFFREDFPGWTSDPRLDNVMTQFREAPSVRAAQPIYNDLQRWFVDYVPVVKLGEASEVYAYRPGVTDIHPLDATLVMWTAKVDR